MSHEPPPVLSLFVFASSLLTQPAAAMTLGQIADNAGQAQPAAFESVEMVAGGGDDDRTPQWQHVKNRLAGDISTLQKCLDNASSCTGSAMHLWREMVNSLRDQDTNTKLQTVNVFFNKWQYRSDSENYGMSDRWAGPIEFMQNSGDCEDYAIAKYTTLLFHGFHDDQMRITAVLDNNRGGLAHAVLSVTGGNTTTILDNLSDIAYDDRQQTGYAPRFAVNQSGTYIYAQQPRIIYASLRD